MPVNRATLELAGFLVVHGSCSMPLVISPYARPSSPGGRLLEPAPSGLQAQQVCPGPSIDLPTLDLSTRIANFLYLAFVH